MLTTFLTHFNTIDKQLDAIIESDKFLPYNEKVNKVAHGHYGISPWIRHHIEQLKYLGEVRNLLIHHQGESHDYVQLTQEAIDDIAGFADRITHPPTIATVMHSPVVTCGSDDLVRDVLQAHDHRYSSIPVVEDGEIIGGFRPQLAIQRMSQQETIDMTSLRVSDIPLAKPHHYRHIEPTSSVTDAVALLADRGDIHALLVVRKGEIAGIITRHDIPKIVEAVL